MAANVTNSPVAITASIMVVRAFIRAREMIVEHSDLKRRLDDLERRLAKGFVDYEDEPREIRFIIARLEAPVESKKRPIGFRKERGWGYGYWSSPGKMDTQNVRLGRLFTFKVSYLSLQNAVEKAMNITHN